MGFDVMGVSLHASLHNQVIMFSPSELRARWFLMSWEFCTIHHCIIGWLWFHHLSFGLDGFWCHGNLAPCSWHNHVIMLSPSELRARWVLMSGQCASMHHGIIMWLCVHHLSFRLDGIWWHGVSLHASWHNQVIMFSHWASGQMGFVVMGAWLHAPRHNHVIMVPPSELRARWVLMSWEFRSMHHGIIMWLWLHHLSFGLDGFWCHGSFAPCIIA
jgi:hypothetical protein